MSDKRYNLSAAVTKDEFMEMARKDFQDGVDKFGNKLSSEKVKELADAFEKLYEFQWKHIQEMNDARPNDTENSAED